MYKQRNFQQNWYGKEQFQTLLTTCYFWTFIAHGTGHWLYPAQKCA